MSHLMEMHGFSFDRLSRLAQLERWHFWFVGRRALLARLMKKYLRERDLLVIDLGCGTGFMLEMLTRQGYRMVGLDLRPEGLRAARQMQTSAWLLQAEAVHLPLKDNTFDVILLLDVLEHVDDRTLLAEIVRIVRNGGWVFISVPAMPWLWSYRDEAAGHLRRYTRQHLSSVLAQTHIHVQEIRYYQCWLLPLVAMSRFFGHSGPMMRDLEERPFPALNSVLAWMNTMETRLSAVIAWPWGSSLMAVCRKL